MLDGLEGRKGWREEGRDESGQIWRSRYCLKMDHEEGLSSSSETGDKERIFLQDRINVCFTWLDTQHIRKHLVFNTNELGHVFLIPKNPEAVDSDVCSPLKGSYHLQHNNASKSRKNLSWGLPSPIFPSQVLLLPTIRDHHTEAHPLQTSPPFLYLVLVPLPRPLSYSPWTCLVTDQSDSRQGRVEKGNFSASSTFY